MATESLITVPARKGKAARLAKGETVKLINTHGKQVVDTWAFNAGDLAEFMSMEHTRMAIWKAVPRIGDTLVTNKRRPILTLVEDTTPGVHDMFLSACDRYRYELLGHVGFHDSCTNNLWTSLAALDLKPTETPCPFNIFQHSPILPDGQIVIRPPESKPGQYVVLKAEMDLVVVFSACPQDIAPTNAGAPTEVHFAIQGPR